MIIVESWDTKKPPVMNWWVTRRAGIQGEDAAAGVEEEAAEEEVDKTEAEDAETTSLGSKHMLPRQPKIAPAQAEQKEFGQPYPKYLMSRYNGC